MSARPERRDWPHAEFSQQIRSGPHDWHVQQMGEGPVVLLLHGAGASLHSFAGLMPILAADHTVIAIDLPGHGGTRRGGVQRSGLPKMAEDIAGLLADMRVSPQAIVGHSAGAAIGLELLDHLEPRPEAVIALNGAFAEFGGVAGWLFPLLAKLLAINPFTSVIFSGTTTERSTAQLISATGSTLTPEQIRLYYWVIRDRSHVSGALAMMSQWDLRDLNRRLPSLETPTLMLAGVLDRAVDSAVSHAAAARMPHARTIDLEGVGHLMHEEDPSRIAAEISAFIADINNAQAT